MQYEPCLFVLPSEPSLNMSCPTQDETRWFLVVMIEHPGFICHNGRRGKSHNGARRRWSVCPSTCFWSLTGKWREQRGCRGMKLGTVTSSLSRFSHSSLEVLGSQRRLYFTSRVLAQRFCNQGLALLEIIHATQIISLPYQRKDERLISRVVWNPS